jgi:hypothetical protein
MYGLPGKKAYTKLDDVLNVRTMNMHEKHGFDVFKDNVNQQVREFHQLQDKKRNRLGLSSNHY